ncbi:MAG: hypothetical protein LM514_05545 [Streptococcus sp.]|nr:hypothetical protein [Streptococcus sp.]
MTSFLLFLFVLICLVIIGWGLMKRDRIIQFPFLAAAVFVGWMLPQLLGLTSNSFLPKGGLEKTIFMAILCVGAAWIGYTSNQRPARLFWWQFDRRRLLKGSAALSLLGAFFFYQVGLLAADVTAEFGGQWTGIITIYVFMGRLLSIGMVISFILYLNKPSWPTLLILLFDLMFYLDRIIIKGRRADTVELGLILFMALWFYRRWLPPRWAMVTVLIVGALVINSIGNYRSTMLGEDQTTWSGAGISEILEIDYVGNLMNMTSGDARNDELTNAVMNIEAADRQFHFDFGFSLWNNLVHSYIPGQWVGKDVKQALMIDFGNPAYLEFRHIPHTGTTHTGVSDAFLSFWYLGAIKFYLIGLIMSRWYKAAENGNIVAQMILMLTVTASLHTVTHSTNSFFMVFIQLATFLLPVLMLARVKRHQNTVSNATPLSDPNIRPVS